MDRVVTVIQARTGSSRLPGKVLLPLAGAPLLLRMYERVRAARLAGTIIIATTTEVHDDYIEELCGENSIAVYRGSTNDLLDRHYKAALMANADVVVKIPSDCPLISAEIIDEVIGFYLEHAPRYDYVSNLHPATFPDGNDVEVMSIHALEQAWLQAGKDYEREHTTPFLWENGNEFSIGNVPWKTGENFSMSHRWTIDYPEDYAFISTVYERLYADNPGFTISDILALLGEHPEIHNINSRYAGVNWYRHHIGELKTISMSETRLTDK